MKIIKRLLSIAGVVALLLLAVMLVNTWRFTPPVSVAVEAYPLTVDSHAAARRLAQALTIKTISYPADAKVDNAAEFEHFHHFLATSFPRVHDALALEKINRLSLLYRWRGQQPGLKPLLLLAHQDVVPVQDDTLDRWQQPPFAGVIKDGVIWGRGAVDDKNGVMAILEATELLLQQGFTPQRDIYFAFGHDEEIGGKQGAVKMADYFKQQGIEFDMVLDEGGVLVSDGVLPTVDSAVALIGIAEKGYLNLKLSVSGQGGHSSMPPVHTAAGVLARAITRIEAAPFEPNMQYSRLTFSRIGPLMALPNRLVFANMWLTEGLVSRILSGSTTTNATIRTTAAVTMLSGSPKANVLPTTASAIVNFRIMPGETRQTVKDRVIKVLDDTQVNVEFYADYSAPSRVSPIDSGGFALLTQSIAAVAADPALVIAPYLVVGGTDAKHYNALSQNIYRFIFSRFSPVTMKQMHGINEQLKVSDYSDTIRFYAQLFRGSDSMKP